MNDGSLDARPTSSLISALLFTSQFKYKSHYFLIVAFILVASFVFVTKLHSQHGVDQLHGLSQRRFPARGRLAILVDQSALNVV